MFKRMTNGEKIFHTINYLFLAVCMFVTVFPLISIVAKSFSSVRAIESGEVFLLPVETNVKAYKSLIGGGQLLRSMKNTVFITLIGTALNMVMTTMGAYVLSKKRLIGSTFFLRMVVFTMMFTGGTIPNFILVKLLNLINTYFALWLPGLIQVYNLIVMRTFFMGLPDSLEEAAKIDGAGDISIFIKIILPLSLASLATIALFYAVSWWNEYFNGMIYISKSTLMPLQVKLKQMIESVDSSLLGEGMNEDMNERLSDDAIQAAAMVVSTVPMLCVYPFLQKYFVKGVMIGAVKG